MDSLDLKTILNVWAAMMVYNIIFKAIGSTLLSASLKGEKGEKVRNAFKERLEKVEELNKQK